MCIARAAHMKPVKDTHFENYVEAARTTPLHPKLKSIYATAFPSSMNNLCNLIFYGPSGTGKYSQVLACISKYSPTHLKYEKRLSIVCNKETQTIKMSDVHFEIDMSLLGCTSKLLWTEMHSQIVDVVSARADPVGIIVCKYFHNVHSELLETFYSYMHMSHHASIRLKYILITEHIGFIPSNILNSCEVIPVARPTSTMYKRVTKASVPNPAAVTNMQTLKWAADGGGNGNNAPVPETQELFDNVVNYICNVDQIQFGQLRELLYDILIYDFDIHACAWHLITELKKRNILRDEHVSAVLIQTHKFLQYYNNNYRPIYHLENFVFMLIKTMCATPAQSAQSAQSAQ